MAERRIKCSETKENILGHGSNGTLVFRGTFDQRNVAVKRVSIFLHDVVKKEVSILQECDWHSNIVAYYATEEHDICYYIAMGLAECTLHDVYKKNFDQLPSVEVLSTKEMSIDLLKQTMKGLSYLHYNDIVHRDLKPSKILIFSYPGKYMAKISDFGIAKKIHPGNDDFTATSGKSGTEQWRAPEVVKVPGRLTFAIDIFSMGCVIYFALTSGEHPFGIPIRRPVNILDGKYDLSALSRNGAAGKPIPEKLAALDLVQKMISANPKSRPDAQEVLGHCLFWSEKYQLKFFQYVSDFLHQNKEYDTSSLNDSEVCMEWRSVIAPELEKELYQKDREESVKNLLLAIRNKSHHYFELSEQLREILGSFPEQFVHYFTDKFPKLLIHTYQVMDDCQDKRIQDFYYEEI